MGATQRHQSRLLSAWLPRGKRLPGKISPFLKHPASQAITAHSGQCRLQQLKHWSHYLMAIGMLMLNTPFSSGDCVMK